MGEESGPPYYDTTFPKGAPAVPLVGHTGRTTRGGYTAYVARACRGEGRSAGDVRYMRLRSYVFTMHAFTPLGDTGAAHHARAVAWRLSREGWNLVCTRLRIWHRTRRKKGFLRAVE